MTTAIISRTLLMLSLMLILSHGALEAQRRGKGAPSYDPATVATLKGTVTKVTEQTSAMGWSGTHLALKTQDTILDVHLGPTSFVSNQGFQFAEGDQIEVTGSKVKYQNADALIARQVKKGAKVLTLRDEQGYPKWSRSRWRW